MDILYNFFTTFPRQKVKSVDNSDARERGRSPTLRRTSCLI